MPRTLRGRTTLIQTTKEQFSISFTPGLGKEQIRLFALR